MKGTAARGTTPARRGPGRAPAQQRQRAGRERDGVDLLRNDLGRIAQIGSVSVPALFELQALPASGE